MPEYDLHGTSGDDRIRAKFYGPSIDVSQGGDDTIRLGKGPSVVYFGAAFTGADKVNGEKHEPLHTYEDIVILDGDYSAGVNFEADSISRVNQLILKGGSYVITGVINIESMYDVAHIHSDSLSTKQS